MLFYHNFLRKSIKVIIIYLLCLKIMKKAETIVSAFLAGETRFEHATYGFGDRYSTVEPLPYELLHYITNIALSQEIY